MPIDNLTMRGINGQSLIWSVVALPQPPPPSRLSTCPRRSLPRHRWHPAPCHPTHLTRMSPHFPCWRLSPPPPPLQPSRWHSCVRAPRCLLPQHSPAPRLRQDCCRRGWGEHEQHGWAWEPQRWHCWQRNGAFQPLPRAVPFRAGLAAAAVAPTTRKGCCRDRQPPGTCMLIRCPDISVLRCLRDALCSLSPRHGRARRRGANGASKLATSASPTPAARAVPSRKRRGSSRNLCSARRCGRGGVCRADEEQ